MNTGVKGVIISVDAITALTIVILVFSTFYLTVSTAQSHVSTLKYAYLMASDTLNALDTVKCSSLPAPAPSACLVGSNTLLAALFSANSQADRDYLVVSSIDRLIPEQYGYSIEAYSPDSGHWATYFNSSSSSTVSRHNAVLEQKARSSAEKVITVLIDAPSMESTPNPYCYSSCGGVPGSGTCAFPCLPPGANTLQIGNNSIKLVRVSVYI